MVAAWSLSYAFTCIVNLGLHENVGACSLCSKAVVIFGAQPGVCKLQGLQPCGKGVVMLAKKEINELLLTSSILIRLSSCSVKT
ncbi:hypothetical protein R1flu_010544 [Riccia fluitans]|uniref:Secreted protein n=1 Tax=Riccia fluitans TaxID=41844 RepID=A0ABD1Z5A5_9MARC